MLTASHFYSHHACPRWAYLEMHGDRRRRLAPTDFMKKLIEDSRHHVEAVLEHLSPYRIVCDRKDVLTGFLRTEEAMADGIPRIAGAVLATWKPSGELHLHTIADLIERVPGRSRFGNFQYEVVEIKTARRPKTIYRVQLAFDSDVLARVQGAVPQHAHLILGDQRRETFLLSTVRSRYLEQFARLVEIEAGREPPVHVCSICSNCSWREVCLPLAQSAGHVSLVSGLQRDGVLRLEKNGVRTCGDLARQSPADVDGWTGCGPTDARRLVAQARALHLQTVVWRQTPQLPKSNLEIYFDIESDPDHDALYLFGVLVRENGREHYRPFLAERPDRESDAFLECLRFLESLPDAPIYHYHHYERTALARLVAMHGVDPRRVQDLGHRLRDVSVEMMASCYLPVHSYSLKSVARYLGFQWTKSESSATQSVVWFSSWLRTGDRSFLDHAIEYNADDCRATRVLKDWLAAGPQGEPIEDIDGAADPLAMGAAAARSI